MQRTFSRKKHFFFEKENGKKSTVKTTPDVGRSVAKKKKCNEDYVLTPWILPEDNV